MKTKVFNGHYFPGGAKRTVVGKDPVTGRDVQIRENYDLVTGLVLSNVSGTGQFKNTGEDYITINGQHAPGETTRITVSAQNCKPAADALLKDNVDKAHADKPLNVEHVVTVVGRPMKRFGLLVKELYLELPDGTTKPIIAAPETSVEQSLESQFM